MDNEPVVQLPAFLLGVFNATPEDVEDDDDILEVESAQKLSLNKVKRTAMGEYIVEPGEKPLTSLGIPAPGPADYSPKITFTHTEPPHYSVAGRQKHSKHKKGPGPADYSTSGDMAWKHKKITLKGRSRTMYDDDAAKAPSDIGPARYSVKVNDVGTAGPKCTMKHRHANAGTLSSLATPADVQGFVTPGPNYRPNSAYWGRGAKKSFGNSRKPLDQVNDFPGPANYSITVKSQGPAYSLAKRISVKAMKDDVPSPNKYDIGTTIGTAVAKSMTARREDLQGRRYGPAPNSYALKSTLMDRSNAKTLKYRWFETNVEYQPGPADYHTKPEVIQPRNPAFSCRKRTPMSYPESKYLKVDADKLPGPANYLIVHEFKKNDSPAFSMGQRSKQLQTDERPGPNRYYVEKFKKPGASTAPAFSMGKRIERVNLSKGSPGPAAYMPTVPRNGPSHSISKRTKNLKGFTNPAPNAHVPPSNQTEKGIPTNIGICFKGRPSPWMYSGFRSTNLTEATSA